MSARKNIIISALTVAALAMTAAPSTALTGTRYPDAIVSLANGDCLTGPQSDGTISTEKCSGTPNQRWIRAKVSSGIYTVRNQSNGHCTNVRNLPGSYVGMQACNESKNQQWSIEHLDIDVFRFVSLEGKLCLSLDGENTRAKAKVETCDRDNRNQKFTMNPLP